MRKIAVQAGLTLALSFGSIACGGAGESGPGAGGSGAGVETDPVGSGGAGGGEIEMPGDCAPACGAGEVCSVTGECIPAGTCAADADCAGAMVCDGAGQCVPGGGCGAQEIVAQIAEPDFLIVLDRSCSMSWNTAAGLKKWDIVVESLATLLSASAGKMRFGLTMFPDLDAESCPQGDIPFPVAPGMESELVSLLTQSLDKGHAYYPDQHCGTTNIDAAMFQATKEPALLDPERPGYVLLVTDGAQAGCGKLLGGGQGYGYGGLKGDEATLAAIQALRNEYGVSTFVVGFEGDAEGASLDPKSLNEFAIAGGVPANDPNDPETKYYLAEDPASLDAALAAIAAQTLSCTMKLAEPPAEGADLYVFFNDETAVAEDPSHEEGWDYDPATQQLTFYGSACEELKSGEVSDVDVVFGCNEPTPK